MAGIFTSYNKVRPGAYTVFKAASAINTNAGTRGVVVLPMSLPWGDTTKLIEVTVADFNKNLTLQKIGLNNSDPAIQPLREALKNASVALVGRLNTGAVKAIGAVSIGATDAPKEVSLVATQGGTLGNKVIVACVKNAASGALELITTVDGREVDRQVVVKLSDYTPNGWFVTSYAGTDDPAFAEFAGTALGSSTPGTDGTEVTAAEYSAFLDKASANTTWNTLAATHKALLTGAQVTTYIKDLKENLGRNVQAVVYNYPDANYEGIISVDQGYMLGDEEVPVESAIAYVAGVTAGAAITQSNTYHVIPGATAIIDPKTPSEIEAGLQTGKLIFSYRQDRSVVIEKDINTLHTFTQDRSYAFSKNRVIRCLDDIATQITKTFENSFIGKVNNDENGRNLFKGSVIGYLTGLQDAGAIQNFDSTLDVEVAEGNDIESLICNIAVQPVDSMEKLYMTVTVS